MIKKRYLILIIIFCLSTISVASAAENIAGDIISVDKTTNDIINVNNDTGDSLGVAETIDEVFSVEIDSIDNSNVLGDNPEGSFTDLANDIGNADGELKLTRNYVYNPDVDSDYINGIVINKEITINGRGFIINGNNEARAFNISSSNVTLRNIEFINCSGSGGAVYWNGDNGSLFDCNFINCYSSDPTISYGGAVYWNGDNGSLFDCNFNNCYSYSYKSFTNAYNSVDSSSVSYGGAVYWNGDNGSLFECSFEDCYSYSVNDIKSAYESNSISKSYGGAVYWNSIDGSLFNCDFLDCYSYSYSCSYSERGDSSSTSFSYGGAVYWNSIDGSLFNCDFLDCYGSSSSISYGFSSVYNHKSTNNSYGGGIYWYGMNGELLNCSFINCHLPNSGVASAIYWYGNDGGLFNCSFINSTSNFTSNLGYNTIYWYGKDGECFNISFEGNYYNYQDYCKKSSTSTVYPLLLIDTSTLYNDDRIVVFESTQLVNNISVKLYNVTDRKILYNEFNISSDDLRFTYTVNNLKESEYQIYLYYAGDNFYTATSKNNFFKIGTNSSYEVTIGDCVVGGNVTIDFSLNEDATGRVKLTLSNYTLINDLVNGKTSFYIPYLNDTINNYQIKYVGDEKYNPIYINDTFKALNKSSIQLGSVGNITVGGDVTINFNITNGVTGYIEVYVDSILNKTINVNDSLVLSGLNAGNHTIKLVYSGDENYGACENSLTFEVLKHKSIINILTVNPSNITFGDDVIINYNITNGATGNINVYVDSILNKTINVNELLVLSGLNAGNHTIKLVYGSDENYGACQNNIAVQVLKKKIDISNAVKIINMYYGKVQICFNSSFNGTLNINISNKYYKSFNIHENIDNYLNLSDIDAGDYDIEYVFVPNNQNYYNATTKGTLTIFKVEPNFDIDINDISYKESANLNINYLNDVTGFANITISNDEGFEIKYSNVALSSGKFNQVLNNLNASKYTITLEYSGNNNYYPTTKSKTFNVFKINPIIIITDITNATYGQTAKITVNSNAEGNITITIGSVKIYNELLINDKRVSQNINDIDAGTYDINVTYNGNNNYNIKTVNTKLTIFKVPTDVVASVDDIIYSQTTIINVRSSVDGELTVKIDNNYINNVNVVANTITSITFDNVTVGKHNVSVVLIPSNKNYNESSFSTDFTVSKIPTSVDLNVADVIYGEDVIVNVTASEDGRITLIVGDIVREKDVLANTMVRINLGILAADSYDLHVEFNAGDNYKTSSEDVSFVVLPAKAEIIDVQSNNNVYGENTIINVKTNVSGIVSVKIGDVVKSLVVSANKFASFDFGILDVGSYSVDVNLDAGENYTKPSASAKVNVTPKETTVDVKVRNSTYGDNVIINVTASENGLITVKLGEFVKNVNIESDELISIDFGVIDVDSYDVNVTYNGNNNYNNKTVNTKLTIFKASTNVIASVDDIIYSETTVINVRSSVDGEVTVKIDNNYINNVNVLANIITPITFDNVPVGKHNVSVVLIPSNKNYNESSFNTDFTVSKKPTSVDLNVADVIYGEEVIVNVTASEDGKITLTVGDIVREKDVLANTMTKINLGILAADSYNLNIEFNAGDNYKTSSKEVSFVVSPVNAEIIDIQSNNNVYGENTIINVKTNVSGNVTVKIDEIVKSLAVSANKFASFDFGILDVGSYSVDVNLDAGENYTKPFTSTKVNVTPKETTINVEVRNSTYGENVIIKVIASENGLITVKLGEFVKSVNIESNELTSIDFGVIDADSYDVNVSFNAGSNFKNISAKDTIVISKANSTVVIGSEISNHDVTLTADINPNNLSGEVVFIINDEDYYTSKVNNSKASLSLINMGSGNYTAKVIYKGDKNYNSSTSDLITFSIDDVIDILAPDVTKYYHGPERFIVTIKKNNMPLSNVGVNIIINGVTYTKTTDYSGQASIGVNLNHGVYNITVEYNGIEVVSTLTILPTIYAEDIVKVYGNATQFYATFTDSNGIYLPKGTVVTFYYNGFMYSREIIDNKGNAMLEINDGPETYILTSHNPVTGEYLSNTVVVISNIMENYDLTKYYNESERFSVRVIAPNGEYAFGQKVKFIIGNNSYESISNSNGYAFLNTVLQPGEYVVTTSFGGNNVSNIIKILPTLSNHEMKVSSIDIKEGETEVIKVVLPNDATGKVSTIINNKEYSANVNNGVGNIIIPNLKYGDYNIDVIYSGDSQYNSVKGNSYFSVDKTFSLIAPDVIKYYHGPERFVVTLKENNKPITNADVKITINGQTYTKTTDSSGQTSMGLNLNSGVYNVTTEYNGIKVYSTVTIKDTVIANDFTKMFRNGTQYYGTFLDSQGNLLKDTTIRININGVYYYKTTNENGVARMNINLNPGTYVLTADNPASGEKHTTTITVLPTIVENHDLTKYYKNASQYTLRLLGPDGKPVGAGESVTLNINGVMYTRTSDASGYVKMNINLAPGTYVITADYNGLKASNTITVKSVLFANDLNMMYKDGSKFEAKVLDGQGRPLAGATVTFNVNGVFYTKVTEEDGIARLTINLPAGNYIITSSFNGLNAANNIIIAQNPMYYTIGSNPLDYNYYMNEYNKFSLDWYYVDQYESYVKTIYDIYGNSGMELQTVRYGLKYVCYEPSTGKEVGLNSAGEVIWMSINRDYTEEYIRYDEFNNELARGRWIS